MKGFLNEFGCFAGICFGRNGNGLNETNHKKIKEIRKEHPVEFYQIEIDANRFGNLKAVRI